MNGRSNAVPAGIAGGMRRRRASPFKTEKVRENANEADFVCYRSAVLPDAGSIPQHGRANRATFF
jgi:hypothetical protein